MDKNKRKIINIIVVLSLPLLFGIYKIIEAEFSHLPYMLKHDNPKLVRYYRVETICLSTDAGPQGSPIAFGRRISDSLEVTAIYSRIREKFDTIPSKQLKAKINASGLEILTYFDKKQNAYIIPHNSEQEIRTLWRNMSLTYSLLASPLIAFLLLMGAIKLMVKIFYVT